MDLHTHTHTHIHTHNNNNNNGNYTISILWMEWKRDSNDENFKCGVSERKKKRMQTGYHMCVQ